MSRCHRRQSLAHCRRQRQWARAKTHNTTDRSTPRSSPGRQNSQRRYPLFQQEPGMRDRSRTRRRGSRSTQGQAENHTGRSHTPIKPISAPFLYTAPELSHGRIDIRGVRSIHVTPIQVNFPCIRSVTQIDRQSTEKKTGKQTHLPQ